MSRIRRLRALTSAVLTLAAVPLFLTLTVGPAAAVAATPVYRLYSWNNPSPPPVDSPCDPNTHEISGANFAMRVCYNYAGTPGRYSPVGRVSFHDDFRGDHVTACQLHLVVTDDVDGTHPAEVNSNCLNQVRSTIPSSLAGVNFWRVGITSPAVIARGHTFHVTFWINMRTSCCYYETYGRASRVNGYSA